MASCAPVESIRKQRYKGPTDTSAVAPPDGEDISKDEWGQKKSQPYTVEGETYYPLEDAAGFSQTGVASWYGPDFHGKNTANGETYNQHAMTAAHKTLPFNTFIRVHNEDNGKTVVVRVNDRGPFKKDRIIDLSKKAAAGLGMIGTGTANVTINIMSNDVRDRRRMYIAGKRLPPRAETME
ncbi:MAG: septal ring lytic transglycosylase RlpA family protein [Nitrospinae bacterium]|nr:septal ring lytic transglycosylase RlpA family protein [Nitrospinota bacterium]